MSSKIPPSLPNLPEGLVCPLDRVLTYKNLIYLLNLQISIDQHLKGPLQFADCNPKNLTRCHFIAQNSPSKVNHLTDDLKI